MDVILEFEGVKSFNLLFANLMVADNKKQTHVIPDKKVLNGKSFKERLVLTAHFRKTLSNMK